MRLPESLHHIPSRPALRTAPALAWLAADRNAVNASCDQLRVRMYKSAVRLLVRPHHGLASKRDSHLEDTAHVQDLLDVRCVDRTPHASTRYEWASSARHHPS